MTTQTLTGLFDEALFLMETDPDKALGLFEEALQHAHDEHDEKKNGGDIDQVQRVRLSLLHLGDSLSGLRLILLYRLLHLGQ